MGVSRQAIAKWESGETRPTFDNLVALAEELGISQDELINYKTEMNNSNLQKDVDSLAQTKNEILNNKFEELIEELFRKNIEIANVEEFCQNIDEEQKENCVLLVKEMFKLCIMLNNFISHK